MSRIVYDEVDDDPCLKVEDDFTVDKSTITADKSTITVDKSTVTVDKSTSCRLKQERIDNIRRSNSVASNVSSTSNNDIEPLLSDSDDRDDCSNVTTTTMTRYAHKKSKICLVCGDRAIGCNFGVISCESCKAFFRRMAFRTIKGRCQGCCDITTETRVYCKSCRLNMCFKVGMKKHMILCKNNDDDKRNKTTTSSNEKPQNVSVCETQPPPGVHIKEEIKDPDDDEQTTDGRHTSSISYEISAEEQSLIDEVNKAFEAMYNTPTVTELEENPNTLDIVNMADKSIRKIIKSCKCISLFNKLSLGDQIEVLKHCAIELLLITSIPYFDLKNEQWFICHRNSSRTEKPSSNIIKPELFKIEGNEKLLKLYGGYIKFVSSVNNLIRGDRTILNLLAGICLFSTEVEKSDTRKYNEDIQERFALLLERYIKINRQGELLFPKLITKLMDLQIIKEQHGKLLSSMHVRDIEPLLRELFNLST